MYRPSDYFKMYSSILQHDCSDTYVSSFCWTDWTEFEANKDYLDSEYEYFSLLWKQSLLHYHQYEAVKHGFLGEALDVEPLTETSDQIYTTESAFYVIFLQGDPSALLYPQVCSRGTFNSAIWH